MIGAQKPSPPKAGLVGSWCLAVPRKHVLLLCCTPARACRRAVVIPADGVLRFRKILQGAPPFLSLRVSLCETLSKYSKKAARYFNRCQCTAGSPRDGGAHVAREEIVHAEPYVFDPKRPTRSECATTPRRIDLQPFDFSSHLRRRTTLSKHYRRNRGHRQ